MKRPTDAAIEKALDVLLWLHENAEEILAVEQMAESAHARAERAEAERDALAAALRELVDAVEDEQPHCWHPLPFIADEYGTLTEEPCNACEGCRTMLALVNARALLSSPASQEAVSDE